MPRRTLLSTLLILGLAIPASQAGSAPVAQCFGGTPGIVDCLEGRFAQYWQHSGGLPVFGFPLTPAYDAPTRTGTILAQMVERNRLEYHPELRPPYDILLGRLGDDLLLARGRDWRREPAGHPRPGCHFARETRHSICDQEPGNGFLTYYRSHGLELGDRGISERESLALWGLPLTEPTLETNEAGDRVLTQWFERARFEWHPDLPARYRVLLGLLGREVWGSQERPRASYQPLPPALETREPAPVAARPSPSPTRTGTATPEPASSPGDENAGPGPTATRTPTLTPTPSSTRTARPTPTMDAATDAELKQRLYDLVNVYHQQAGCGTFTWVAQLDQAAQAHAEDIALHKRISHIGTDGATVRERVGRTGYPYNRASESIAVYKTPEIAVQFWMDEPPDGPHRLNITNCQYTDVGIGLAYDDRGWRWWVMDVANRRAIP